MYTVLTKSSTNRHTHIHTQFYTKKETAIADKVQVCIRVCWRERQTAAARQSKGKGACIQEKKKEKDKERKEHHDKTPRNKLKIYNVKWKRKKNQDQIQRNLKQWNIHWNHEKREKSGKYSVKTLCKRTGKGAKKDQKGTKRRVESSYLARYLLPAAAVAAAVRE